MSETSSITINLSMVSKKTGNELRNRARWDGLSATIHNAFLRDRKLFVSGNKEILENYLEKLKADTYRPNPHSEKEALTKYLKIDDTENVDLSEVKEGK